LKAYAWKEGIPSGNAFIYKKPDGDTGFYVWSKTSTTRGVPVIEVGNLDWKEGSSKPVEKIWAFSLQDHNPLYRKFYDSIITPLINRESRLTGKKLAETG